MDTIKVFGNDMLLDNSPVSKRLRKNGIYEAAETKIMMSQLKPGDHVLDIGAHIGYHTLIAANIVGDKGHVFAIEPNDETRDILIQNVAMNGFRNVTVWPYAALDTNRFMKLWLDSDNPGNHKLFNDRKDSKSVAVECKIVDELLNGLHIDFIKIDVQGAELQVLRGLKNTIKNSAIKMIIEFYPYGIRNMKGRPIELLTSLINYGFGIYNIVKKSKNNLVGISRLRCFSNSFQDGKFTNLFCIKE